MNALTYALVATVLAGCVEGPSFITPKHQIEVYEDYSGPFFTPEVVDHTADTLIDGMISLGHGWRDVAGAVLHAHVVTYPEPFPCPVKEDPERRCTGIQMGPHLAVAVGLNGERLCVWKTALAHEMLHRMLEVSLKGNYDPHHERAEWALAAEPFGSCE